MLGRDGAIKLWDLSNTTSPFTTLQSESVCFGHAHIYSVMTKLFYTQTERMSGPSPGKRNPLHLLGLRALVARDLAAAHLWQERLQAFSGGEQRGDTRSGSRAHADFLRLSCSVSKFCTFSHFFHHLRFGLFPLMSAYLDTEYSACSAEFSPFHSNLLALGLYQITPDEDNACSTTESPATKRLGRCLLFDTSQNTLSVNLSL